jgi:hypothetical protein
VILATIAAIERAHAGVGRQQDDHLAGDTAWGHAGQPAGERRGRHPRQNRRCLDDLDA